MSTGRTKSAIQLVQLSDRAWDDINQRECSPINVLTKEWFSLPSLQGHLSHSSRGGTFFFITKITSSTPDGQRILLKTLRLLMNIAGITIAANNRLDCRRFGTELGFFMLIWINMHEEEWQAFCVLNANLKRGKKIKSKRAHGYKSLFRNCMNN